VEPSDLADVLSAVRDFVRKEVVPLEERIDAEDAVPERVVATCKEMGLYGFAIPEEYGGLGMTLTEEAQLAFELGWTTPALRSLSARTTASRVRCCSSAAPTSRRRRGCRGWPPAR
jgi:acyl-CoA dehydrogenase